MGIWGKTARLPRAALQYLKVPGTYQDSDQRGQVSIMVGLMLVTFLLLFVFVVNIGMMVHAKINLQNAADMAAYSGAATQARQLNQISYLNYEMRRQYKKFLFRYYVMGGISYDTHPGNGPGSGPMEWRPHRDRSFSYQIPAVCIIFSGTDNFCRAVNLEQIDIPAATLLDSINETLRGQLTEVEAARKRGCRAIGNTNKLLLNLWLWNVDTELDYLFNYFTNSDLEANAETVRALTLGIGLVPAELLLKRRIQTLQSYVNAPSESLTIGSASALQSSAPDSFAVERPLQSFFSAYYTLGEHIFIPDTIQVEEIMNSGGENLKLNWIESGFDTYAIDYHVDDGGDPNRPTDCVSYLAPMIVAKVPLGVYKDPRVLTYYAVRVSATAKLLFSPFGDIQMRAYSAARPFGSRIGPPLEAKDFVMPYQANTDKMTFTNDFTPTNLMPNLPITPGDAVAQGRGWDRKYIVGHLYQKFAAQGQGVNTNALSAIGPTEMNRAYQAAMVPNPWEEGKYNIINDLRAPGTANNRNYDEFNAFFDKDGIHAMWAPVVSPNSGGDGSEEILALVSEVVAVPGLEAQDQARLREALEGGIREYMNKLRNTGGYEGDGMNVTRLNNPFKTRPEAVTGPIPITLPNDLFMRRADQIRTSWSQAKRSDFRSAGRLGYSVKFVSFQSLKSGETRADGATGFNNTLAPESDAAVDLDLIQH